MRSWLLVLLLGLGLATPAAAADWTTPAEATDFRTTPDYADTLAYLKRLEQAAAGQDQASDVRNLAAGPPHDGGDRQLRRRLYARGARAAKMPVILVQAGIHPGEIEGKDAGLMLLRDFAVTGKLPHLLDHVVAGFHSGLQRGWAREFLAL